jgi:hypothetical protein
MLHVRFGGRGQRDVLRMNDIRTNASNGSKTRSVDSIHSAQAGLPAYFDEQLPYQPVMAV